MAVSELIKCPILGPGIVVISYRYNFFEMALWTREALDNSEYFLQNFFYVFFQFVRGPILVLRAICP